MPKNLKILIFLTLLFFFNLAFSQETEDDSPKLKKETKLTEVIVTDSASSAELLKRAVTWVKVESARYGKTNGVSAGTKAECMVTFPVKPKELNPKCDYEGKVTMRVIIECKDNKYRYTITNIKHISNNGRSSAGSVDNIVPDCGTLIMIELVWKKLKGEALGKAGSVANDIKEGMKIKSSEAGKDNW
jgi:hypothetical protein